ncbi:E3 ubiquitin-protein ligase TRAIP-like [Saccostrea cucullata]|uniref:E3 ubiquitin-protein ligase TRAIP-like n=1 Tax=Saccostrea cuccullata TaxID=36930 RepID=UPI002ED4B165
MNAQCSIFSEHFFNDLSLGIAAVQCGHTFHKGCLSTWLKNSKTCPKCRCRVDPTRVINRLFFDEDAHDDNEGDDTEEWKLKTKVKSLKEKLKTVKKERDLLELEVIYLKESITKERETCSKIKQKFSQYQNIERLLKECEVDIKETIQEYDESTKEDLATYCSVLKRKYDKNKSEKKKVKSEFKKFRQACE